MLYILNHTIFATIVAIALLLPVFSVKAAPTLAEMAAGLSIDETLEEEGRLKSITAEEPEPEEPIHSPLLPKRQTPGTAVPSNRVPLYMFRSYDNNYKDEQNLQEKKPDAKPETKIEPNTSESPAEMAVEKNLKELRELAPATGGEETIPPVSGSEPIKAKPEPDEKEKAMRETILEIKEKSEDTPPSDKAEPKQDTKESDTPTVEEEAPGPDDKEKAMRKTINAIKKKNGEEVEEKSAETAPEPKASTPSHVTRIGSVPSMEKEVDYVGVLENSLLLDPQPLPVKLPFYDENGNPVTLKQFKGKLIVLNFWATWCTPCAMEMPSLDALQESFDDRELPVKVIALSQDFKGVPTIRAFYDQNKIQFLDIYHDQKNALFRELGIISLPTTMLIDQQGREILRMSGYIDWHKPEVQEFVRGFLRD